MTLVDLSHPIAAGMRVYPGDPQVDVDQALTVDADGVNVLRLHLGSQSGTHVDAPFHVRDDLLRLDELALEQFWGDAVVLDARAAPPRTALGPQLLATVSDRLRPGVVVLIATGWDQHWPLPAAGSAADAYLAHPWPGAELAHELVDAGIRTVGIDALSVDRTPDPHEPASAFCLDTHLVLAGAGAVIAENLRGLTDLLAFQAAGARIEVSLLPLHLPGADGAPVRAVARLHGV